MSESMFFYDPSAFTAHQMCSCRHSRMMSDVSMEGGRIEGDKYKATMVSRPLVCSVCKTPYRVRVDTRRVAHITGLGS